MVVLGFEQASYSVLETANSLMVCVVVLNGTLGIDVSVSITAPPVLPAGMIGTS